MSILLVEEVRECSRPLCRNIVLWYFISPKIWLHREYISKNESLTTFRGKLDINGSIRERISPRTQSYLANMMMIFRELRV